MVCMVGATWHFWKNFTAVKTVKFFCLKRSAQREILHRTAFLTFIDWGMGAKPAAYSNQLYTGHQHVLSDGKLLSKIIRSRWLNVATSEVNRASKPLREWHWNKHSLEATGIQWRQQRNGLQSALILKLAKFFSKLYSAYTVKKIKHIYNASKGYTYSSLKIYKSKTLGQKVGYYYWGEGEQFHCFPKTPLTPPFSLPLGFVPGGMEAGAGWIN